MVQPRAGFWLLLATAASLAAASLERGAVAALLALALAAGVVAAALSVSREDAKAPRRAVGAGVAAALLGLALALVGGGGAALATLALGAASAAAGTRLSLERAPVARELSPRTTRSPSLALALAADEVLLFSWDLRGSVALPGSAGFVAARLRAAAERNRERGFLASPEAAHPIPPALEKPEVERVSLRGLGTALHLRFESEYEPPDPEAREAYLAARANRTAHAWLWRSEEGRPALVCLHGYTGGRAALDARVFEVLRLRERLGIDVALFVLPLHGPRALGRRSGQGFLGGDPLFTNAAVGQAIFDLRRLTGWLRTTGAHVVGVHGGSLGGYVTALYASLDPRLACAVPLVPAASLARIVWSALPEPRRRALEVAGASESLLEEAWAAHAPLRHRPKVAPEGRLILAAAADRICTPDHARDLHAHWGGCAIHWFPGSHIVPLGRGGVRLRLEAFLRQRLLARAPAEPILLSRFRGRT